MAKQPKAKESKVEDVTEVIGKTAEPAAKKKGGNLSAHYINEQGQEVTSMPESPAGIIVRVGKAEDGTYGIYGERRIMFADLPDTSRIRLLAFGLKTAMQNSVNTAATPLEGWDALERRSDNFLRGVWAEAGGGGGGGTPMFLLAFRRAAEKAGRDAAAIDAAYEKFLSIYNDETGTEKEAEKRRKDLRTELMGKPAIKAAFLELQAEAVAKRQAALAADVPAGDQFADLGV